MIDNELHERLLLAVSQRHPTHIECGKDLDWKEAEQRIATDVIPCLEQLLGYSLYLDKNYQDMFLWCCIYDLRRLGGAYTIEGFQITVLFSTYANLAGVVVDREHHKLDAVEKYSSEIGKCLQVAGFIPIDSEKLEQMSYDGPEQYFLDEGATWYDRFFGYT
ncbi:MAG TPA: hypothetical protein VJ577_11305 [Burkholderiaceae bacterium]|nr:hypothetical protein [Burkholderiaceae bacterium]